MLPELRGLGIGHGEQLEVIYKLNVKIEETGFLKRMQDVKMMQKLDTALPISNPQFPIPY